MCDISAALTLGSMALGIGGAAADHAAQKKQYEANKASAIKDLHLTYGDIEARKLEERTAMTQERELAARAGLSALGLAKLNSAETGVAGASVTAQANDLKRGQGELSDSLAQQLALTLGQLDRSLSGAEAQARSRIAGVAAPNAFATGLRMAGIGLDTATTLVNRKKP